MNRSLEWRLARAFVRCYALFILIELIRSGPRILTLLTVADVTPPNDLWKLRTEVILGVVVSVVIFAVLLRFSNRIAARLAGTPDSSEQPVDEKIDVPFDLGVSLVGLVILVEGLTRAAGEAVYWFINRPGRLSTFEVNVDVRGLAISAAEAVLGLVLFVGAKAIVQGILKLRGMPPPAGSEESA